MFYPSEILGDPYFMRVMFNMAFAVLVLALVIAVVCVVLRLRHKIDEGAEREPMILLIASTKDAMLITALYLSESLTYLANEFFGFASQQYPSLIVVAPVLMMGTRLLLITFAGWIAVRRVYLLGMWLKAKA